MPADRPPPLSPTARDVLAAFRAAQGIPEQARGRIWGRLLAATREPRRSAQVGRHWAWVGALAFAAALALAWALGRGGHELRLGALASPHAAAHHAERTIDVHRIDPRSRAERTVVADRPNARVQQPDARVEAPAGAEVGLKPSPPTPSQRPDRKRSRRAPDASPREAAPSLAEENQVIREAWRSLKRGNYERARTLAERHARWFPHSGWQPERDAIVAVVDCATNSPGARERARAMVPKFKKAAFAHEVRDVCSLD